MEQVIIIQLIIPVGQVSFQHTVPEYNRPHRLKYHVCYINSSAGERRDSASELVCLMAVTATKLY